MIRPWRLRSIHGKSFSLPTPLQHAALRCISVRFQKENEWSTDNGNSRCCPLECESTSPATKRCRKSRLNVAKLNRMQVTPHFSRIRGEAHVRWNEINRLRQKFREVIALVQCGQAEPPLSFSYEEPR